MIGNLPKVLDFNRLFLEFYTNSYVTIHWFGHACMRTWSNYHKKVAIICSPPKMPSRCSMLLFAFSKWPLLIVHHLCKH